jgi:hypothetical protein
MPVTRNANPDRERPLVTVPYGTLVRTRRRLIHIRRSLVCPGDRQRVPGRAADEKSRYAGEGCKFRLFHRLRPPLLVRFEVDPDAIGSHRNVDRDFLVDRVADDGVACCGMRARTSVLSRQRERAAGLAKAG